MRARPRQGQPVPHRRTGRDCLKRINDVRVSQRTGRDGLKRRDDVRVSQRTGRDCLERIEDVSISQSLTGGQVGIV